MALHSSLTGADLHEPKGVASASAGEVYVADGGGSGSWDPRLPSQTSNSGKVLTTNGTTESWSGDSAVRARGTIDTPSMTWATGVVNFGASTHPSTGSYNINFSTPLASTNYQVVVNTTNSIVIPAVTSKTVNGFTLTTYQCNTATVLDPSKIDFVVYGGF